MITCNNLTKMIIEILCSFPGGEDGSCRGIRIYILLEPIFYHHGDHPSTQLFRQESIHLHDAHHQFPGIHALLHQPNRLLFHECTF